MKKLLIATMAAVSVGLCVKAEDTGFISTSFEDITDGSELPDNIGYLNWPSEADDALFVVSNLTAFANKEKGSRPDYWATALDMVALTIDTSTPLCCDVNSDNTAYQLSEGDLFFDSVVQFTATDVVANPDSRDKLRVWLYTSPDDVSSNAPGLFKEESPITNLVVTAGKYANELNGDPGEFSTCNYQVQIDGDVELKPDTWHRLTIKAIADVNPHEDYYNPAFQIWVDGKPVTYGAKTQFPSLKEAVTSGNETLQCVAFDGKGAVDDIVFTTKDPFAARSYVVATSVSEENDVSGAVAKVQYKLDSGEYTDLDKGASIKMPLTTTTFTAKLWISDGAKLVGGTKNEDEVDVDSNYAWTISFDAISFKKDGTDSIVFEVVVDDGTEEPVPTYAVSVVANALEATVGGLSAKYAEGNVVTFTVVAATGYTIEGVAVAGAALTPNGNTYTFTMPAEAVTITVTTKAATPTVEPGKQVECDSEEAAKKVTITVTDKDAAAAGQAAVIKAVVKQNGDKWVVTAEINTEATGYIPADDTLVEVAQKLTDIANATEDEDGNVTVVLSEVTPGLYYSVDVSENLAGANHGFNSGTRTLATSAGSVTLKVSKPKGNSAFFKVVQHLTKE